MSIISKAYAEGAAPAAQGGGMEMIIMLAVFGLIFYFMIYRPQAKRAKEHQTLIASLNKGDEVVTSGGIVGKVTKVTDDYIAVEISDNVEIKFQKGAVVAALPKGTLKGI